MPDNLLNECFVLFHTRSLYEVLGIDEKCKQSALRKSFYKASLLYHPDRHEDDRKQEATKKFQTLSRVYAILSDEEKRKIYDETGVTDEGDDLTDKSYDDWVKYWNLLFPRVTTKQIDEFHSKYKGSQEELKNLADIYNRCEGDMDVIMESLILTTYQDEDRIRGMIKNLIDQGRIKAYDAYLNEDPKKKLNRAKRAKQEERLYSKQNKKNKSPSSDNFGALAAVIQAKNEERIKSTEQLLDRLTEKYCKPPKKRVKN